MEQLIELMKVGDSKGVVFIRPSMITTRLIFRNGLTALRCCLEIVEKMTKAKIEKWDDGEFGPGEGDEFGFDSIDLRLPSEHVNWERTSGLGMMQFYEPGVAESEHSISSVSCPHEMVGQALWGLARMDSNWLYPKEKPKGQAREIKEP